MKTRKKFRIEEALGLAEDLRNLLQDFSTDIESGWDDPECNVSGWKPTDIVNPAEHDEDAVKVLLFFRSLRNN